MLLELSEMERQVLADLVSTAYANMNPEIHHAVDPEYRDGLKERKATLKALLERLGADSKAYK
jgi:hypothetical protein